MDFDDLLRIFWSRPAYQRLFLAFTVGIFLSCGARMASGQAGHAEPADSSVTQTMQPR